MENSWYFLNLRFVPNRMDLVLSSPKWILKLLSRNHSHRLLKSLFKYVSILVTCVHWKTRQESPAYGNRSVDTVCFILLTSGLCLGFECNFCFLQIPYFGYQVKIWAWSTQPILVNELPLQVGSRRSQSTVEHLN